jgi:hypothetical protein
MAVRATGQQTAKLRDFYPIYDGNTVTLRRFFFVCTMRKRLMPGMRGLQDGVNRNKRVVLIDDRSTRQNLPNSKIYEYETMNASISTGVPAHNPLQALARLLPTGKASHIPLAPSRKHKRDERLQLTVTETGLTAYRNGSPVAWIVPGFHDGQSNNEPLRCDFVDVAYFRQHREGINMETADFFTLEEAVAFINGVFGGAA